MPMNYSYVAILDSDIPRASSPIFQHLLDAYASETNKVISVWRCFYVADMTYKPHPRSRTVVEIFKHQLLSERRFFGEFLGAPELAPAEVLPRGETPGDYSNRMRELAVPRLGFIARQNESWWLEQAQFFDVVRRRVWIFWRRVLHTSSPHAVDGLPVHDGAPGPLNLRPYCRRYLDGCRSHSERRGGWPKVSHADTKGPEKN
jgi:hypothetical protein